MIWITAGNVLVSWHTRRDCGRLKSGIFQFTYLILSAQAKVIPSRAFFRME
jgi:hypothetical protein